MTLAVTLTIAAACAIINLWLALRITRRRLSGGPLTGDGGDAPMLARMRAQANFTEYAPFVLILIGGIEFSGGSPPLLWIAGGVFVVARLLHPFGMDRGTANPLRAAGALLTWVILALLAGWALAIVYGAGGGGATVIDVPVVPARG